MSYKDLITIESGKRSDLMGLDQQSDNIVWKTAKKQDYIIVSKDSDFNELLILKGFPPKVI